jgi:hypothetical protein
VIGTVVISRFASLLPRRLTMAGVPHDIAVQVASAASHGATATLPSGALGRAVIRGVSGAFTDAVHLGLVVTACALVAAAILAVIRIRANIGTPAPARADGGQESDTAAGNPPGQEARRGRVQWTGAEVPGNAGSHDRLP